MGHTPYTRDFYTYPAYGRKIREELFQAAVAQDSGIGVQQGYLNLASHKNGEKFSLLSGFDITTDGTDVTITTGYVLKNGVIHTIDSTIIAGASNGYIGIDYNTLTPIEVVDNTIFSGAFLGYFDGTNITGLKNGYVYSATEGYYRNSDNIKFKGQIEIDNGTANLTSISTSTIESDENILYIQKTSSAREVYIYNTSGWESWTPASNDTVYLIGSFTVGSTRKAWTSKDNITIIGNGRATPVYGFYVTGNYLTFINIYTPLTDTINSFEGNNIIIDRCIFSTSNYLSVICGNNATVINTVSNMFYIYGGHGHTVIGNIFSVSESDLSPNYAAIKVDGDNCIISNNYISCTCSTTSSDVYGLRLNGSYNTATGNYIYVNASAGNKNAVGVYVIYAINAANYNTVIGNSFCINSNGSGYGYAAKVGGNCNNISSNAIYSNLVDGVNTTIYIVEGSGNVTDGSNAGS